MRNAIAGLLLLGFGLLFTMVVAGTLERLGQSNHAPSAGGMDVESAGPEAAFAPGGENSKSPASPEGPAARQGGPASP